MIISMYEHHICHISIRGSRAATAAVSVRVRSTAAERVIATA